uniref:Uncharacterized protein n=1 Tax=Thermosphaera aggregans TaxID=54254 RepID=A0A7C2FY19_9CREN
MRRNIAVLFSILVLTLIIAQTSYSNTMSNLEIYVEGSPVENSFTGYARIMFAETLRNYTEVSVYIPFEGGLTIVNITSGNGVLISDYYLENNTVSFLAVNTSEITIYFTVEAVFEEAGIGSYMAFIDLTKYAGIRFNLTMNLAGTYNVEPSYNTRYSNGNTLITINQPGYYPVTIYLIPETTTPAQPSNNQGRTLILVAIIAALAVLLALIFLMRRKK